MTSHDPSVCHWRECCLPDGANLQASRAGLGPSAHVHEDGTSLPLARRAKWSQHEHALAQSASHNGAPG